MWAINKFKWNWLLNIVAATLLTGCSLQDVNVEKKEESSPVSPTVNSTLNDEPVKTEKIKSEKTISDKDIKKIFVRR